MGRITVCRKDVELNNHDTKPTNMSNTSVADATLLRLKKGFALICDVCFRRYRRKVRIRRRGVFIFHVSGRVPNTDLQPHPKPGLKAHSVSCPAGLNSHEPKSSFLPGMCLTGVVWRGWPGCEGSIFMLRKCQHLLMLTWTADAELSGNITICFFCVRKSEMFQFFGVRARFGHLDFPVIKQTKLRHQP